MLDVERDPVSVRRERGMLAVRDRVRTCTVGTRENQGRLATVW
jgi:hypothetical protein